MIYRKIGIILLAMTIIAGCARVKTIENLGIIMAHGIDYQTQDKLNVTSIFYQFKKHNNQLAKIISGNGTTEKKARQKMNYQLGYRLDPGSLQLVLFGKKAAKHGIIRYLDTMVRDPKVSNTMQMAVSDTTAHELLEKLYKAKNADASNAIQRIIKLNVKQDNMPNVDLHNFMHFYYEAGSDPILPIFSFHSEGAKLKALGLFQGNQLVDELPIDRAFYINMFYHKLNNLTLELQLPLKPFKKYLSEPTTRNEKHLNVSVEVVKGTGNTKLLNKQTLHYKSSLYFGVVLLESSQDIDFEDEQTIKTFQHEAQKEIKQQFNQLLTRLKQVNSDPIGYGQIYATKKRSGPLKKGEWRDKFPNIQIDTDVDVKLNAPGETP